MRVTIDEVGRIVIPQALRDKLQLVPGSELEASVEGDRLVASRVEPAVTLVEQGGRLVARMAIPGSEMTQDELLRLIDEERTWRRCS